ncbi:MAG TPA: SPOR domain-containing protein [Thermoanaerobaculia bacterium]|nr:SPOR domain-containing protein [Thermoanaerobaculia bacterium]
MTEEKDGPVHYQVSVTGRQAAAFFLVLLAALGLSFFFGMKTGAAAKRGPDAVTALAAQSDLPVRLEADEGSDASPTPLPTEAPLGFSSPGPARAKEPAPTPRPEPVVKEEPAPAPVVKELSPEPTAVPKAAPADARGEEGPFWVQLLGTSSAEKADALAKRLKADGFRPDVSLVPGKKGLFRVRIGPYPDRARAEAAMKKAVAAEKLDSKPFLSTGK